MASDNFNRANGGLGANWDSFTEGAANPPQIFSNEVYGETSGSAESFAFWNADSFADDQFSEIAVGSVPIGQGKFIGAIVRASTQDHYYLLIYIRTGPTAWSLLLFKKTASVTYTQLSNSDYGSPFAQGDVIRLEAEGSQLRGYLNGVEQIGLAVTDTTYPSGDQAGMTFYITTGPLTGTADNWAGGDLHPASSFVPRIVEYA